MPDSLGDRMKRYEAVSRILLPIRSYVIIRIDGCHFHTFTKGFEKPFSDTIIGAMKSATRALCETVQGCKLGYVQSDEASFLLTDFDDLNTSAWYDNQLQKIVSVSASIFTAEFNHYMSFIEDARAPGQKFQEKLATFDARAFVLPDHLEVMNYFLWRIKDAERNSLAGLCQSLYSHKDLMGKNASQQQELLFQKGINWNDYNPKLKRGLLFTPGPQWAEQAAPMSSNKEELLEWIPVKA